MSYPQNEEGMEPLQGGGGQFANSSWEGVFDQLATRTDTQDVTEVDGAIGNFMTKSSRKMIDIEKLKGYIRDHKSIELETEHGLSRARLLYFADQLSNYDRNGDGSIDRGEWELFLRKHGRDFMSSSVTGGALRVLAYAPIYSCSPPALFLILITALQIALYVVSIVSPEALGISYEFRQRLWPLDSFLVYNPYVRKEAWRFVSYMFLHGNHQHIIFNCIMQLIVGLPIEMSQLGWIGSFRVAGLYLAGVALGGLGASCVQPDKFLLGASAGVYALIAAHLATLIMNWHEDGLVWQSRNQIGMAAPANPGLNPIIRGFRLTFIILFALLDVGSILYKEFVLHEKSSTSYAGHGFGALAGLLIGVFLLENRKVEEWETWFKWIAFVAYFAIVGAFVAWHVLGTSTGWFPIQCDVDPTQALCNI